MTWIDFGLMAVGTGTVALRAEHVTKDGAVFTEVEAYLDGEWRSLGDPWPSRHPSLAQVRAALDDLLRDLPDEEEG